MKSILISIRPKWCELIACRKKTIEVRKTRPKLESPFKCYIYETKGFERVGNENLCCTIGGKGHGAIIGEFVCDAIYEIKNVGNAFKVGKTEAETNNVAYASCLDFTDMHDYLGHKGGYGWHISDLKIYDQPKKLSEFLTFVKCHRGNDRENCSGCWDCEIKRPPQSWCYVEDMK